MGRYGAEAARRLPLDGRQPAETDYAYFAGLFDGEGSIDVGNGRNPRLKISMTDGPTIAWLERTFGGKVHTEKPSGSAKKEAWRWYLLPQADVKCVLTRSLPYLNTKLERATAALDVIEYLSHAKNSSYRSDEWMYELERLIQPVYAKSWPQRRYEGTSQEDQALTP